MEFAAFALFVGYLLPWVTAVAREHERHAAILVANLLLGWTVVGWIAVLAYAWRSEPHGTAARSERRLRLVPNEPETHS